MRTDPQVEHLLFHSLAFPFCFSASQWERVDLHHGSDVWQCLCGTSARLPLLPLVAHAREKNSQFRLYPQDGQIDSAFA